MVQALFENATSPSDNPPAGNGTFSSTMMSPAKLNPKSIAGIATACVIVTLFLAITAYCLRTRRKRYLRSKASDTGVEVTDREQPECDTVPELDGPGLSAELIDPRPWLEIDGPEHPAELDDPRSPLELDVPKKLIELDSSKPVQ